MLVRLFFVSVTVSLLLMPERSVQAKGEERGKRRPPPEAFEACANQAAEAACEIKGRRGETLTGSCFVPPHDDSVLVCRPDHHDKRNRRRSNEKTATQP
ncbi:MAG: hypothetical protein AAF541_12635 [Pseudomonadota bacterium]